LFLDYALFSGNVRLVSVMLFPEIIRGKWHICFVLKGNKYFGFIDDQGKKL